MRERVVAAMNLRTSCPMWVLLLVLVVGPACAGASTTASPGGEPAVRDLSSIGTLQDRFDRDTGNTRLILLISPT